MRSDDLVPLLGTKKDGTGYRTGVVIAWNADTAENIVSVAGGVFEDLPILNTSEASLLAPGDVVVLITWGISFAILGRVVIPGTAEAVSSIQAITNRIQAASDDGVGTRNSSTYGDLTGTNVGPSVTIRIGSSGRALVFWSAEIGQTATPVHEINPHVGVEVTGATSIAANAENALNVEFFDATGGQTAEFQAWFQVGTSHLFTGLNPGNTTFTLKYRHDGMATALIFQTREIAVFAL